MYITSNPRTKKAAKEALTAALAAGEPGLAVFQPGPFPGRENGSCAIEGPHYPEPHRWYGSGTLRDGYLVALK